MKGLESFDELLAVVHQTSGGDVDPNAPINQLDVDSMDLLEWLVLLEDEYGVAIPDSRLDAIQTMSLREMYDRIVVPQVAAGTDRHPGSS